MVGAMGQASADLQQAARELSNDLTALKARLIEGECAPADWEQGLADCALHSRKMEEAAGILNRALGGRGESRVQELKAIVERGLARFRSGPCGEFSVEQALGDDLPQVLCDDVQIEYVIWQLLVNAQAASASEPGAQARLTVSSAPGGVEVLVEDDGECLEAELIDRIFDPFVEDAPDPVGPDRGGLRDCLRIIEEHGGEFVVQPGGERGNRISFVLPVQMLD